MACKHTQFSSSKVLKLAWHLTDLKLMSYGGAERMQRNQNELLLLPPSCGFVQQKTISERLFTVQPRTSIK